MSSSTAPFPAVLTDRRESGAGLNLVTLTPAPDRALGYRAPGQYIEVRTHAKGYFVLAGEIGAPSWDLLVRPNGGASDALTSSSEGTVFDVVGPLGTGFPLDRARGRPLVVAVAGSALAVTRPILRDRVARCEGALTSVYIGARTVADVALAREVAGWVHAGVRIVLCLSRALDEPESQTSEGPNGRALERNDVLGEARQAAGYVQNVLANDVLEGLVSDGLVFAAGPAGMLEALQVLQRSHAKLEVISNV